MAKAVANTNNLSSRGPECRPEHRKALLGHKVVLTEKVGAKHKAEAVNAPPEGGVQPQRGQPGEPGSSHKTVPRTRTRSMSANNIGQKCDPQSARAVQDGVRLARLHFL
jgi:hypothetical protein